MILSQTWRAHEKLRYIAVGAWNTMFAYLAFAGLFELWHTHLHYLVIGALAHMLAAANAFFCQRRFVFLSSVPWWPAYLRFNLVQLLQLAWGLAGLFFLVDILHIHPLVSQLMLIALSFVAGYLFSRDYTFRA